MTALKLETDYYENVTEMAKHPLATQVLRLGDILNTKASALLTHVSIMIAASTAIFVFTKQNSENRIMSGLLVFEIVVFLITTLLVLSTVSITGPKTFPAKPSASMDRLLLIIRFRRRVYRLALRVTFLATLGLVFIMIFDLYQIYTKT